MIVRISKGTQFTHYKEKRIEEKSSKNVKEILKEKKEIIECWSKNKNESMKKTRERERSLRRFPTQKWLVWAESLTKKIKEHLI